jgi:holliday junction DNA helicase RuvB
VGIETLAATMVDDSNSIEEVCEPFLMQLGFVKRSKQGRIATKKAFDYLGIKK